MEKKMNNKGFSLVELIIVIAIMAVLIGVLAPQYLRYVENSRLQKDNQAIAEVANSIKIAMADETINKSVSTSATFSATSGVYSFAASSGSTAAALEAELYLTVGSSVTLSSNTYASGAPTITVTNSSGTVTVTASGYKTKSTDSTGITQTF